MNDLFNALTESFLGWAEVEDPEVTPNFVNLFANLDTRVDVTFLWVATEISLAYDVKVF